MNDRNDRDTLASKLKRGCTMLLRGPAPERERRSLRAIAPVAVVAVGLVGAAALFAPQFQDKEHRHEARRVAKCPETHFSDPLLGCINLEGLTREMQAFADEVEKHPELARPAGRALDQADFNP